MATILSWGDQSRCDARCHNAEEPECDCMCEGRFHGKGLIELQNEQQAQEFLEELAGEGKINPVQATLGLGGTDG